MSGEELASAIGRDCAECGDAIDTPRWTRHSEDGDLHFCSDECRADWGFDRAVDVLKEEMEACNA